MPKKAAHQFKGFEDWIHIFDVGSHTDSGGNTRAWSRADLQSLITSHNPKHPAPLVVGHPSSDDPRYGQVAEYKLDEDGRLWFKGTDIEPGFEQMVLDKRFPERSLAIDSDGKGGFKVRHIGFLGAVPPALALAPMRYGLAGQPAFEYAGEFTADAYTPSVLGRAMRRLREFIVEHFGVDAADKVVPEYELESIQEHATDLTNQSDTPSHFSQSTGGHAMPVTDDGRQKTEDSKAFTQADIDAAIEKSQAELSRHNDALKAELDQARRERLSGEYQAEVDKAITEGRLTPAQAEGLTEFMLALPDGADASFAFARGEGAKAEEVKQTPMQFFAGFISKLGKQLELNTEQGGADTEPDETGTINFTMADTKATVDAERLALHNKALEYQKQHPSTTYIAAIQAVGG